MSTELEKHRQESELRGQQLEELREADRELSARLEAAEVGSRTTLNGCGWKGPQGS